MGNYSELIKKVGSIKNRDLAGEVLTSLLREIYEKEWKFYQAMFDKKTTNIADILERDGIAKLPIQKELAKSIKQNCIDTKTNIHTERTIVIPDSLYVEKIMPLLLDSKMLTVVGQYLQAPARLQSWAISWNNRCDNPKEENGQLYHRDRDDFKSLRLYLYLNAVNMDNGPHYYIKGSHLWSLLKRRGSNSMHSEIIDDTKHKFMSDKFLFESGAYTKSDQIAIVGNEGFCWLEDGGGLHKGSVPLMKDKSRLMLSITWGIHEGSQYVNAGGNLSINKLINLIKEKGLNLSIIQKYALGIKNN